MFSFLCFTDPATTEIYTLSLHDALPISAADLVDQITAAARRLDRFDLGEEDASLRSILSWSYRSLTPQAQLVRSEEHTSELQSRGHLVCRLLLEKKKNNEYRDTPTTQTK